MKKFRITEGKGFQIDFANGYTVSVQFGYGNYIARKGGDESRGGFIAQRERMNAGIFPESNTAETAIMDDKVFVQYKGDDVQGYQTPGEVLETMNYAASLPSVEEKENDS